MFSVTLSGLITVYLLIVISGLAVLWIYGEIVRTKQRRRVRRTHLVCDVCSHHYRDATDDPVPPCPECGRPNERGDVREL